MEGWVLFILTRNVIYPFTFFGVRDGIEIWYAGVKGFKLAQEYI